MKIFGAILLVVILGMAATSLYVQYMMPEEEPTPGTVRVAHLTGDLHEVAYAVANNKTVGGGNSFFDKNHIKVVLADGAPYANGGIEMDNFMQGKVDMGYLGLAPAITKHLNVGIQTKIISEANEIGSALIVAKSINKASDLKGKTIATPGFPSIQYFLLRNYLQQNNIDISSSVDPNKVVVVNLGVSLMKIQLSSGQIDGFIAWEPFCSDAILSGTGKVLVYSKDIWADHPCCVLAVDQEFASHNTTIVDNFLRAHIQATEWIQNALASPSSSDYNLLVSIAMSFTEKNATVIKSALGNINFRSHLGDSFTSSFKDYTQKIIDFNITYDSKLTARGYSSITDFSNKYIDLSYQSRVE